MMVEFTRATDGPLDSRESMGLSEVISGGSTRVDQAALYAARDAGIATGGWCPPGWKTECGYEKWLEGFNLVPYSALDYIERAVANIRDSDGTLWIGVTSTTHVSTMQACTKLRKPFFVVTSGMTTVHEVFDWITVNRISTLNVAGNRNALELDVGTYTYRFLLKVFRKFTDREHEDYGYE